MKTAFWNVLSFLAVMAMIAILVVFTLIYLNPHTAVNPFPPPTLPAALIMDTSTPSFAQFPATWTPASSDQQVVEVTLRPSSTPLPTQAIVRLYTKTPTPTRTATPTKTATATITQTPTRTKTILGVGSATLAGTPNRTSTALALLVTNAAATSKAKTATAQAGGTGATQTAAAMPPNPASATETHGAASDTWQKTTSDPAFTWSPVSGAAGYYLYWGSDPNGISSTLVTSTSYDPPAVTTGAYYLRLRTIFSWGVERPNWTTVFVFRFDNTPPGAPASASEANGAVSGVWQNTVADPAFTWSAASDVGSGVAGYDVYFGSNPNGIFIVATSASPAFDYPSAVASGTYYLRGRSVDGVNNTSDWATMFTFRYDGENPDTPTNLTTGDPQENPAPTFTWSASSDLYSGVAAYEIFWGTDGSCGAKNQPDTTGTGFTAPTLTSPGTYRLCVRARDNAGNVSSWAETTFTYTLP